MLGGCEGIKDDLGSQQYRVELWELAESRARWGKLYVRGGVALASFSTPNSYLPAFPISSLSLARVGTRESMAWGGFSSASHKWVCWVHPLSQVGPGAKPGHKARQADSFRVALLWR